uniref:Putative LAGLIDADG homing endonuclease n=1 Tax=Lobochlamys culleus TaxID=51693 RepID=A0A0S2ICY4_9CHLO|nr:putative LAGLIDADG homing endonuclease [Lobochlamys culleus]
MPEGSFITRDTNVSTNLDNNVGTKFTVDKQTKRADFEITQHITNIKLLKFIRTELGFGTVSIFEKNGFKYAKWFTSKRENIILLIYLLNGHLILEKRRHQFIEWLNTLNEVWNLNIQPKPFNCQVSLQTSWLAGFSDADAGFYTNVKKNFRGAARSQGGYYVRFITKFYITQRDEIGVLTKIKNLVGATNKISQLTNGKSNFLYNRLEITSTESTQILIQYFTEFPLKGIRKIDLLRWVRVQAYKNMFVVVSEKAAEKLARLITNLQEPTNGFTLSQEFSKEEKAIFADCPLNQKNPNYAPHKSKKKTITIKKSEN